MQTNGGQYCRRCLGSGAVLGVEESVPLRSPASAGAAAIFLLSASCGARQAAGSSPINSEGDCFRAGPAGGGCRLEGRGQRPPPPHHFPGYAGLEGKGNRGHPDFTRLRAAPVPRGQDAAKRDSPQQVRPREPRVGRGRLGVAARGCGASDSEGVRNLVGRVVSWRNCWLAGLAQGVERRFGTEVVAQILSMEGAQVVSLYVAFSSVVRS